MEGSRKRPQEIGLARVFAPGRRRHQCLAAAYERLVPIRRVPGSQQRQEKRRTIQAEGL